MQSQSPLLSLIGSLYRAPGGVDCWHTFLFRQADLVRLIVDWPRTQNVPPSRGVSDAW
jgi:hypothetical protein